MAGFLMTVAELFDYLVRHLPRMNARSVPPGIVGPPGIGKSYAIEGAFKALGWRYLISRPLSTCNECDIAGYIVPDPERGRATQLHPDLWPSASDVGNGSDPFGVFADELPQSSDAVQRALMPVLYHPRRVGTYQLPDCVRLVWAGNRKSDRAGAGRVLSTIYNRSLMIEVRSDLTSFLDFAQAQSFAPEVLSYLRTRPDHLNTFNPSAQDQDQFASERTWEQVSDLLKSGEDLNETLVSACGLLGSDVGASFVASIDARIVPACDIIAGPDGAPVPTAVSVEFATAHALCDHLRRISRNGNENGTRSVQAATRYAVRLSPEIAAVTLTTCAALDWSVLSSDHVRVWSGRNADLAVSVTKKAQAIAQARR